MSDTVARDWLVTPRPRPDEENLASCFANLMTQVGRAPMDESTHETPGRAARAFLEMTRGYREDPMDYVKLFPAKQQELVVIPDIEFSSLCEHHLLPYVGKCNVGYLPDKWILGLSKFSRIVDLVARRFTVQEELTEDLASFFFYALGCRGVIVEMRAKHLCMCVRGAKANSPYAVTSQAKGEFLEQRQLRDEFYNLLGREKNFI